jgi:hypothetical protein
VCAGSNPAGGALPIRQLVLDLRKSFRLCETRVQQYAVRCGPQSRFPEHTRNASALIKPAQSAVLRVHGGSDARPTSARHGRCRTRHPVRRRAPLPYSALQVSQISWRMTVAHLSPENNGLTEVRCRIWPFMKSSGAALRRRGARRSSAKPRLISSAHPGSRSHADCCASSSSSAI